MCRRRSRWAAVLPQRTTRSTITAKPRSTIDITYPLDYPELKSVSDFVNADRRYRLDRSVRP